MSLSWNEILKRAEENNKTVICEVEKRRSVRYFNVRCNKCNFEKESPAHLFLKKCVICFNCFGKDKELMKKEFIIKAKNIHSDKYNYDLVEYIDCRNKVKIFCNKCKDTFLQKPRDHLQGCGCKKCGIKKSCLSNEDFILKSIKVHNKKYNYDLVQYINNKTKVSIKCNKCEHIFLQTPNDHLQGYGCKKCADNNLKSNTKEFIIKAKKIHGDKFNYDLVEYVKSSSKINIKCNKCNKIFLIIASNHLKINSKCSLCSPKFRYDNLKWIDKAREIHGDKFNYDLVEYIDCRNKVIIQCNKCYKTFFQAPYHHISGKGCPFCNESKGELFLKKILTENNIEFIPQHTFPGLANINALKCDVYVPIVNLIIEIDGDGHRKACFGSTPEKRQKTFEDTVRNDAIKDNYAKVNGINMLRIPVDKKDKDLSFIGEIAMNCYNDLLKVKNPVQLTLDI